MNFGAADRMVHMAMQGHLYKTRKKIGSLRSTRQAGNAIKA